MENQRTDLNQDDPRFLINNPKKNSNSFKEIKYNIVFLSLENTLIKMQML